MRIIGIAAAAALVAGCGGGDSQQTQAAETAAALDSGEYALTWSELEIQPSDEKQAVDQQVTAAAFPERTCIAAGGAIELSALAAKGDDCHAVNSYVRNGNVNVQLSCTREGKGKLSEVASGKFTADAFDATIETSTSFDGAPNYTMTRKVNGKRVGECTAETEAAPAGTAKES